MHARAEEIEKTGFIYAAYFILRINASHYYYHLKSFITPIPRLYISYDTDTIIIFC